MSEVAGRKTCVASLACHMEEVGSLDFSSLKRKKLNLSFWLNSDLKGWSSIVSSAIGSE